MKIKTIILASLLLMAGAYTYAAQGNLPTPNGLVGSKNVIDVSPPTQLNGPWRATVDCSNTVQESNEGNNPLTYLLRHPGPLSQRRRLPDLMIKAHNLIDPYGGHVAVKVWNKGNAEAAPCVLRLIIWESNKFEQKEAKTVFVKVPAIAAGVTTVIQIKAGATIISTNFSLFIDISNDVTESNENNNRAEGEAGKY